MTNVLLVLHLMIAAALVGVVLLQKSEGGALGIGGGGGAGGFLTGRGTANLLTRLTAGLAAGFFLTSLALTIIANRSVPTSSVFDKPASSSAPTSAPVSAPAGAPAPGAATGAKPADGAAPAPAAPRGGILDKLQK